MKPKHVKHFLTFLATAFTCVSLCTAVWIGNPGTVLPDSLEPEITQELRISENGQDKEKESEISPLSDLDDGRPKGGKKH